MELNTILDYSEEVHTARKNNQPIVAIESAFILDNTPYPENIEILENIENIIRQNGSVPATIAVVAGRIKVGLDSEQIKKVAISKRKMSINKKDLPFSISKKETGGLTVASTITIANLAGIQVCITNGINGVNHEAQITMDISEDIQALAQNEVAVVVSGTKLLTDIDLTLEYLETNSVPIIGYKTTFISSLYTQNEKNQVDYSISDPYKIAAIMNNQWNTLKVPGSMIICTSLNDKTLLENDFIDSIIQSSLSDTRKKSIKGRKVDAYAINKIRKMTNGVSLNIEIEAMNKSAVTGSIIARHFNLLKKEQKIKS
jgi:pseudouridylate synthase